MDYNLIWMFILLSLIPAAVTGFVAWSLIKKFLETQEQRTFAETLRNLKKDVLPLRLQAYERLMLLMERLQPVSLVSRLKNSASTARDMQQIMIGEVRAEFEHNLTQQVYVSHEVWVQLTNARENLIKTLYLAGSKVPPDASNIAYCRVLLEIGEADASNSLTMGQLAIKEEIKQLF